MIFFCGHIFLSFILAIVLLLFLLYTLYVVYLNRQMQSLVFKTWCPYVKRWLNYSFNSTYCAVGCTSTPCFPCVSVWRSTHSKCVQTVLSDHCPQGFRSHWLGQDPEVCIFDKDARRSDFRWSWTTLGESEVDVTQAGCWSQAHWSGWMWENSPSESQSSPPSWAAGRASWAGSGPHKRAMQKQDAPGDREQQPPL